MKVKTASPKPEFSRTESNGDEIVSCNWGHGRHTRTNLRVVHFYKLTCGHIGRSLKEYDAKYAECTVCRKEK